MTISTLLKGFCVSAVALGTATTLISNYNETQDYIKEQEVLLTDNLIKQNEFEAIDLESNLYADLIKYNEPYKYSTDSLTDKYWVSALDFNSNDDYSFYISFGSNDLKTSNNFMYYGFWVMDAEKTLFTIKSSYAATENREFEFHFTNEQIETLKPYTCVYIRPFIEYNTVSSKHKDGLISLESENASVRFALQNTSKSISQFTLDDVSKLSENSLNQYATLEELYSFIEDDEIIEVEKEEIQEIIEKVELSNKQKIQESNAKFVIIPIVSISLLSLLFMALTRNKKELKK